MPDLRQFASFWGMCGALLCCTLPLISALSATTPVAGSRRRALLEFVSGVALYGPIVAEVFTPVVLHMVPALDMRAVALALGLIAVPITPAATQKLTKYALSRLPGDKP